MVVSLLNKILTPRFGIQIAHLSRDSESAGNLNISL